MFKAASLANRASYATWGGQTYTTLTENTPFMGSGHWPSEGLSKAAYVNNIKLIGNLGTVFNPKLDSLKTRESNSNCYKAIYVHGDKDPWVRTVYFGGPAGCVGT